MAYPVHYGDMNDVEEQDEDREIEYGDEENGSDYTSEASQEHGPRELKCSTI